MNAAPDLMTPEGRAAYRRELRCVARPVRMTGFAATGAGVALGLTRFFMTPWPPWLQTGALLLCLSGLGLLLTGIVLRTRYHLRRLQGH